MRGIRVIVVVANSVSATASGLWWIIVVVTGFLLLLFVLLLHPVNLLASMSVIRFRKCPASQKPFLCAVIYMHIACQHGIFIYKTTTNVK